MQRFTWPITDRHSRTSPDRHAPPDRHTPPDRYTPPDCHTAPDRSTNRAATTDDHAHESVGWDGDRLRNADPGCY